MIFTISKPILRGRGEMNKWGKRMTKRTETCNAPHNRDVRKGHSTKRQNWFPLLAWSSSLVPITRKKKRKKKSSSQNLISKSIHKMKKDAAKFWNKRQFYTARGESTPLSAPANTVNPPRRHATSNVPSRLQFGRLLKESLHRRRSGGTLLMPHIHKWSVSSICPT